MVSIDPRSLVEISFDAIDSTDMFDALARVRAVPVRVPVSDLGMSPEPSASRRALVVSTRDPSGANGANGANGTHGTTGSSGTIGPSGTNATSEETLAEVRGYDRETLMALAEIGYRYLRSGGDRLAGIYFDALSNLDPSEPYFWLARAFLAERRGDRGVARSLYSQASLLAPNDARPDVNIAELDLLEGEMARAKERLSAAKRKAEAKNDRTLAAKADALLDLIRSGRKTPGRGLS